MKITSYFLVVVLNFDLGDVFSFYELKLIEIKGRGIMVTTKAYLEKILKK